MPGIVPSARDMGVGSRQKPLFSSLLLLQGDNSYMRSRECQMVVVLWGRRKSKKLIGRVGAGLAMVREGLRTTP